MSRDLTQNYAEFCAELWVHILPVHLQPCRGRLEIICARRQEGRQPLALGRRRRRGRGEDQRCPQNFAEHNIRRRHLILIESACLLATSALTPIYHEQSLHLKLVCLANILRIACEGTFRKVKALVLCFNVLNVAKVTAKYRWHLQRTGRGRGRQPGQFAYLISGVRVPSQHSDSQHSSRYMDITEMLRCYIIIMGWESGFDKKARYLYVYENKAVLFLDPSTSKKLKLTWRFTCQVTISPCLPSSVIQCCHSVIFVPAPRRVFVFQTV